MYDRYSHAESPRPDRRPGSRRRRPLPHDRRGGERRRPFTFAEPPYRGRGEAGRYGGAPVPYGPDHTYDYHFGDRFGYGPDFRRGEERIRRLPARPRRPRGYRPW